MRSLRLSLLLLIGATACAAEAPTPPVAPPAPPPALTVRPPDWGPPPAPAERRIADLRIAPVATASELSHLDVTLHLSEPPGEFAEPEPLSLFLAREEEGEGGWAEAIEDLYARDADGALPLRLQDAAPPAAREWRSERRPVGPIHITYRVRLARSDPARFHGTRAHAGGFEGDGATFLLFPVGVHDPLKRVTSPPDPYHVRLSWDLARAGEGVTALATIEGEKSPLLGAARAGDFMAGHLGRLTIDDGGSHFDGAWLGRPGIDMVEVLSWLARLRNEARALFREQGAASFSVLVRAVPGQGLHAGPVAGGLRILAGEAAGFGREERFELARGLVHQWIGGPQGLSFSGPPAAIHLLDEGLTAHFARELLLRSGLVTIDEVAEGLRALPPPGVLYAAELDTALRAASGNKRSLDDLVASLVTKARAAATPGTSGLAPLGSEAFREQVGADLGQAGLDAYDSAVVRGEPVTGGPTIFGPCFTREKKKKAGRATKPGEAPGWVRDPRAPAACARRGAR